MKYAKSAGKQEKNKKRNGALELWIFCGQFSFEIIFIRLSLCFFIYFRVVLRKTRRTNNLWCATSNSNLENRVGFFASSSCVLCATPAAHCRWRLIMEWGGTSTSCQMPFPFAWFPFRFHFDSIVAISVRWHCQRSTLMHTHTHTQSQQQQTLSDAYTPTFSLGAPLKRSIWWISWPKRSIR